MWGMWSLNGDQSGQWRSISMISQWPLIMTSQWAMTLLEVHILGMSIVTSQCVMMLHHCITIYNDIYCYEHFLVCILCSMPNCVILLWVVWNKNKNKVMFDQSGLASTFVDFCIGLLHSSFGLIKLIWYPYINM